MTIRIIITNSTNSTDNWDPAYCQLTDNSWNDRFTFVCISTVITAIAVAVYVAVIVVLIAYRKSSFSNPFFILAITLGLNDLLPNLSANAFGNLCLLFGPGFRGQQLLGILTSIVLFFGYSGGDFVMLIIAVNRYVSLILPLKLESWFSPPRIKLMILASIFFGLFAGFMNQICGCPWVYYDYYFEFQCDYQNGLCPNFCIWFCEWVCCKFPAAIGLIYLLLIIQYVRQTRQQLKIGNSPQSYNNNNHRNSTNNWQVASISTAFQKQQQSRKLRQECSLVLQSFTLVMLMTIFVESFWHFRDLFQVSNSFANKFINIFQILTCSSAPFLYLTFCREIRIRFLQFYHLRKYDKSNAPITNYNKMSQQQHRISNSNVHISII